jgi:hypothetical protein
MLREDHRLKLSENRALRKISGLQKDEVTGEWGRWHNDTLHDFYSSLNTVRVIKLGRMRWAEHVARMVGKPERQTPFGKTWA